MTLILSNDDVEQLLTMADLIPALEEAYVELVEGRGGNRLRSDIVTPTPLRDDGLYALKSMDGVVPKFEIGAVRINSDILTFPTTGNEMRRVKAPSAPGNRYVGLVLLFMYPELATWLPEAIGWLRLPKTPPRCRRRGGRRRLPAGPLWYFQGDDGRWPRRGP